LDFANSFFRSPSPQIVAIFEGKKSKNFNHPNVDPNIPEDCCFSVVTKNRTLDLQAPSAQVRNLWVAAIQDAVVRSKELSFDKQRQQSQQPQGLYFV